MTRPTLADLVAARERLAGIARVTPVLSSGTIGGLVGRAVSLKAENLQLTGSFKIRGAYNTIAQLTESERQAGVVTASAGNHGQAVAWAARQAGIAATIFVPEGAPMTKVDAARGYGATVVLGGEGFDEAVAAARLHVETTGATFVHAFDDPRVIAGGGHVFPIGFGVGGRPEVERAQARQAPRLRGRQVLLPQVQAPGDKALRRQQHRQVRPVVHDDQGPAAVGRGFIQCDAQLFHLGQRVQGFAPELDEGKARLAEAADLGGQRELQSRVRDGIKGREVHAASSSANCSRTSFA